MWHSSALKGCCVPKRACTPQTPASNTAGRPAGLQASRQAKQQAAHIQSRLLAPQDAQEHTCAGHVAPHLGL